jgi:hypothetical protein
MFKLYSEIYKYKLFPLEPLNPWILELCILHLTP